MTDENVSLARIEVLYDHNGFGMSVQKGEMLTMIKGEKDWWLALKQDGSEGYVPANHCRLLSDEDSETESQFERNDLRSTKRDVVRQMLRNSNETGEAIDTMNNELQNFLKTWENNKGKRGEGSNGECPPPPPFPIQAVAEGTLRTAKPRKTKPQTGDDTRTGTDSELNSNPDGVAATPTKPVKIPSGRKEEINVLVISETGVGKSTWINAIGNYITYETVEEALAKPHVNLIPTAFTISVKNGAVLKKVAVKVGESENEVHEGAASSTQYPRSYVFEHNSKKYRMIDTPGIGDTRGLTQDKENIRNIINFVAKFEKIHAICILMMPNQAKLTPTFEFCFKELITQFHRSAVKNIVFCFSNTSGCGFCVGETHETLEILINEINQNQKVNIVVDGTTMYPFDNMAYRYLCAKSRPDPITFSEDLESIYQKSYINSRNETLRLFEYISTLEPHKAGDSVDLKYVRDVIEKLTRPLAIINTEVNKTLDDIQEKENEILMNKDCQEELRKTLMRKLKISHIEVEKERIYFCRFCAECEEYTGAERMEYVASNPKLASQDPINLYVAKELLERNENCPRCGNRDRVIKSKRQYVRVYEEREEENANQRVRINDMQSLYVEAKATLIEMRILHGEISDEQKQILEASARFACFMKANCITAYNDMAETYISMLIKVAKEKNRTKEMYSLTEQLLAYREQKRVFEEGMKWAELNNLPSRIESKDILKAANELKTMKHYGKDVSLALNAAHDGTNLVEYDELHYSAETGLVTKSTAHKGLFGRFHRFFKKTNKHKKMK